MYLRIILIYIHTIYEWIRKTNQIILIVITPNVSEGVKFGPMRVEPRKGGKGFIYIQSDVY